MKEILKIVLPLLFLSISVNAQTDETVYEITMYAFYKLKKDDASSLCTKVIGHQIALVPRSLDSDLRWKIRKKRSEKLSREGVIKVEASYRYVRKNDWIIIVDHILEPYSSSKCKGYNTFRELFWISRDKVVSMAAIDKLVHNSVRHLWNKNKRYKEYKVIEKFQPFNEQTDENGYYKLILNKLRDVMTQDEKNKLKKSFNAACMCVRG